MIKISKGPQKTNLNTIQIIEIARPKGIKTTMIGRARKLTANMEKVNNVANIRIIKVIMKYTS